MAASRKTIWAWMFFDWAQQPFFTLGLTFVFAPYFSEAATAYFAGSATPEAHAQSLWSAAQTITGLLIAFSAPILGNLADRAGRKKLWTLIAALFYSLTTAALCVLAPDGTGLWLALGAFCLALIAAEAGQNFNNALLPSLGNRTEIGRISGSAAAFGYWGGVVALVLALGFFVEQPNGRTILGFTPPFGLEAEGREGTRAIGPFIAIWNLVFLLPFLLWMPENHTPRSTAPFWASLKDTLKRSFQNRSLKNFLLSSMLYRDAMNAIYAFGGIYAALVLGWPLVKIGVFGVISAISAAAITWVAGLLDSKIGPKPVILVTCWLLILICALIVGMTPTHLYGLSLPAGMADSMFMACGALIGGAGGAIYASSRSLMTRHLTPENAAEAFGLFALSGRATAFLAPALITGATLLTGSTRLGLAPVIGLFLIALVLLRFVDPEGDRP